MTAQTKQDKLLMHPRRPEVSEIAQYLVEMGEAEEGQDGWYMTFDHKINQLLELINSEVLSAISEIEDEASEYMSGDQLGEPIYEDLVPLEAIQSIKNRYKP